MPHGAGEYVGDDLSVIKGTWVCGDLEGRVVESAPCGFVVYDGQYAARLLSVCLFSHGWME